MKRKQTHTKWEKEREKPTQKDAQFIIIIVLCVSFSVFRQLFCILKFIFLDTKSNELRQKHKIRLKPFLRLLGIMCMHQACKSLAADMMLQNVRIYDMLHCAINLDTYFSNGGVWQQQQSGLFRFRPFLHRHTLNT